MRSIARAAAPFVLPALLLCSCNPHREFGSLTDREKSLFVTVEEMRAFGVSSRGTSDRADIQKRDMLGSTPLPGGYLEYSYEFTDDGSDGSDYVYLWNVIQKINMAPWVNLGLYLDLGVRFGLQRANRELVELPRLYRFNDQSKSFLVMEKGRPIGNLIQVRDGGFQYLLLIYGVYFDDEKEWDPFFRKKIQAAHRFFMNP